MKYSVYHLLILCILFGCKKELPYPDVNNDDLIVMNAILSPETGLSVHLSQSCHLTNLNCFQNNLESAKVILKDEVGKELVVLEHQSEGVYAADGFQIEQNTSYQIEAQSLGLQSITSQTSTPKSFVSTVISNDEEIFQRFLSRSFKIEIEDNPDERNYYLIDGGINILNGQHDESAELEINGYILPHTGFLTKDINADNKDIVAAFDGTTNLPLPAIFLTDENFNGQTYPLDFAIFDEDINWSPNNKLEAIINVKSVSKEMYDYFKSVTLYNLTVNNVLSEPQPILSNIEKGIGIFGGFSQQELVVDLPKSEYWFQRGEFRVENNGCTGPCTLKFLFDAGEKVNLNWDFGDGTTSTERNPEHEYKEAGVYTVSLEIKFGEDGFSNQQQVEIK